MFLKFFKKRWIHQEPSPAVTLQFQDQTSAFQAITSFDFRPGGLSTPCLEGWIVVRIEEQLGIVEARFYPPQMGYRAPSAEEIWKGGRYNPSTRPRSSVELEATIKEWREKYPDSLIMQLSKPSGDYSPHEFLQRQLAGVKSYFAQRRLVRAKETPWSQQDFMDCEAVLAGVANSRNLGYFSSYAPEKLRKTARLGRRTKELRKVQQMVEKLKRLGYDAYDAYRQDNYASTTRNEWLNRMRVECPGFSDWAYEGAIDEFGFWAAR